MSATSPRTGESISPRKNNVQLLNITGGGGGGVIKEMSASLLKTLLGGDNAKYPVILDFSKGYMLNNDYFLASCPDIIKECVSHDLNPPQLSLSLFLLRLMSCRRVSAGSTCRTTNSPSATRSRT
jgi:hypothetical protein